MNVYARFFDNEIVANSFDELWSFICGIEGLIVTEPLRLDVLEYVEGKYSYAKRFKVNTRSYFILIKTTATTLQEFKENANKDSSITKMDLEKEKENFARIINERNVGWYMATLLFKRVVPQEVTGKFQYINTEFSAKLKACSIQDCYDRVITHLKSREDVDPRSQFPSIKGHNFIAHFQGM